MKNEITDVKNAAKSANLSTNKESQLADLFERMEREILLPHKYYPALEFFTYQNLKKEFEENPTKPIKDIVATTIQGLDPRIPADKVLDMTVFVIKTWNSFSNPVVPIQSVEGKTRMPTPA